MKKKYSIEIEGKYIGYTFLEINDASMGVVMGKIYFEHIESGYEFLSNYCEKNKITMNENDSEDEFIITYSISELKVFNSERVEIKGVGIGIQGFADDVLIDIYGIAYPFYGEEFHQNVEASKNRFK